MWTIIALIVGPILAVQVQSFLNKRDEIRKEKIAIFKTLMATRATPLSHLHVSAINSISTVFYRDVNVITAFKAYLDHLNIDTNSGKPKSQQRTPEEVQSWSTERADLLADLLQKMGKELNYTFDITQLKQGAYMPVAHGELEDELIKLRKLLISIAEGELSIGVRVNYTEEQVAAQKIHVDNLNAVLTGHAPISVQTKTDKVQPALLPEEV